MPKSKYPQEIDTSVEIPAVRDNITEIGSDVINSIRSAIFRIEATLGINPQGATGNSVSERIGRSLDGNGNILREALDRSNVLSGPIIDANVSRVASIQESKLKLNFPTTLLQDEISILNNDLNLIRSALEELSLMLAIHTEPTALNRHSGVSISISAASVISSDIASLSLAAGTLQSVLEELYNAHINYSGANISSLNNSHLASQIFFDTENTSDVIFSDDLQGAMEDLANTETVGFRNSLLNITSNGRIRTGTVTDEFEGNSKGSVLVESVIATFIQAAGSSATTFSISGGAIKLGDIVEFDVLTLSGSTTDEDNKDYQIAEVIVDGSDLVQEVIVYGGPIGLSESGMLIEISKNIYVTYNVGGFATVAKPRASKTNTPDVQFLNPDSATIVSSGIDPSNITATTGSFDVTIDGGSAITIDAYSATALKQSIDSIVQSINDVSVDDHLNITAFKVKRNLCFELAISHNVPNISGDVVNRTILIEAGSSNDGTTELGLSSIVDLEVEGRTGNALNINGVVLSEFGLIKSFDSSLVSIVTGTLTLSLFSGAFYESGVRVGDLVVVTGSTDPADDGTYRLKSILDGIATLDLSGTTFSGDAGDDTLIQFIRATANVGELTFEETSSVDGSILFDVFITEDKDIFQTKRMEVEGSMRSGTFFAAVSDVSRGFILSGDTSIINVGTDGYAILTGPDFQPGEAVFVGARGIYRVFGSDALSFVTLEVSTDSVPLVAQSVTLYGFDELSSNNYHICRGSFSTSLGRILGDSSDPGIPALIDKRRSGTADSTIIGESFIERYIQGPRNELRGSGVIKGCLVSGVTFTDTGTEIYQNFDVGAGIAVVNGIRFEYPGVSGVRVDTALEYYIAMDNRGCIIAEPIIDSPIDPGTDISPFFEMEVATLAEVVNDGTSAVDTDLRLFIDNLDYKVVGDIKVAPDSRHGHFSDLQSAVDYSKRFSKMFPNMGRPSILIENGTYTVDSTIVVDFDVNIKGSGPGTIFVKSDSLSAGTALNGDDFDMGTSLIMIGASSNDVSDDITFGVDLGSFTYNSNATTIEHVGCVIALTQPISKGGTNISRRATYRFENIMFNGPSTIDGAALDPDKIGEYALVIGQQDPATLVPETTLTMGNVIFTNNRLNRMGVELGAIKFTESTSSTMQDIIVANNIFTRASPNVGDSSFELIQYPTTPTVDNIVEIGNATRIAS
jgi:hypothetical protein